jgi:asparagine synthase (glutamine-hydrolysing)
MCGIFGVWHRDRQPVDLTAVQYATTILRHRGPDDEGYLLVNTQTGQTVACGGKDTDPRLHLPRIEAFFDTPFDLVLGHRRLAILDLSPAGHQPMGGEPGAVWLVYNGEIYNYLELRAELQEYGHIFRTDTDTEVIRAAYQHWGPECLSRFNGIWAFTLWDHARQCLFMARDRFGVKPLYYSEQDGKFAFASEIKALVGRQGIRFDPDDTAIYQYLVDGVLPNPQGGQTFFRGVQGLPPGHAMTVQRHAATRQRYWTLPSPAQRLPQGAAVDAVARYRELFLDAVRLQLRADVPVGTCLSGGLDSSSIVCAVHRFMTQEGLSTAQIGEKQKTFSAVYHTAGSYNERPYIETVLHATSAEGNFTFPSGEWLQQDMERLVWHQEEPFQSTSIFAQWCVMSKVRERGVKVLLDGQGADELLGGYRPFDQFLSDLLRQGHLAQLFAEVRALSTHSDSPISPVLVRALAWQLPAQWWEPIRHYRARKRRDEAMLQADFAAQYAAAALPDWWPRSVHRHLESHLRHLVEESSLPHLLRYEDRNSMAFGIEARVPYLDHRLAQFIFRDAPGWRLHQGWTKWIMRKAMAGTVPDAIVWRRDKVGFETPERTWVHQWCHTAPDLFGEKAHSGVYLDLGAVRRRLASWTAQDGAARLLWRWINLEVWLRVWHLA